METTPAIWIIGLLAIVHQLSAGGTEPYLKSPSDPFESPWRWTEIEQLDGKWVKCMDVGPGNVLWLGCRGEALSYDGRNMQSHPLPPALKEHGILSIHGTGPGIAYALADKSIYYLNKQEWKAIATGLPIDENTKFREDPHGSILLAVDKSIVHIDEAFVTWLPAEVSHPISSFSVDSSGRYWTIEEQSGTVSCLRLVDEKLVLEKKWPNITGAADLDLEPDTRSSAELYCDSLDRIWVANNQNDLPLKSYDPRKQMWETHDLAAIGGTNFNFSVSETKDGIIRVTGIEKIHRFDGSAWTVYDNLSLKLTHNWSEIHPTPDGTVWFFERAVRVARIDYANAKWTEYSDLLFATETNDGSRWFLSHDHRVVRQKPNSRDWELHLPESGIINKVSALFPRRDGTLLAIGAHQGQAAASIWDGATWRSRTFPQLGENLSATVLGETSQGTLFLSAHSKRKGSYDWRLGKIASWSGDLDEDPVVTGIPSLQTAGFAETSDQQILVGGYHLREWDGETLTNALPEGSELAYVDDFAIQSDHTIWLANWGQGLERWSNGSPKKFGKLNGLSSHFVASIINLKEDRVAVLTSEGLDLFDGHSWASIPMPDFGGARDASFLSQSADGSIWINAATNAWFIDEISNPTATDRFKTLQYSKDRNPPDTTILSRPKVKPNVDSLVLGWSGSDYWFDTPTELLAFSYRIDGGEWSHFSAQRSAYFENLLPGERMIEVRARDLDGNIDPSPAQYLALISIPFWETRLFLVSSAAIVLLLLALIFTVLILKIRHTTALAQMRMNFLTNISHELRSPLMLISGPLETLVNDAKENSLAKRTGEIALRNTKRLTTLVEQLLDMRKLEAQKRQLNPEPCELVSLTRRVAADFNTLAQKQTQCIRFDANVEAAWLQIDVDSYRKILDNLVLNAIKYSEARKTTHVQLKIDDAALRDYKSIELTVEDEGIGIDPQAKQHIFEAFYAGKKLRHSSTRSFGIGLSIVKDLTHLNNGEITVESPISELGGSRFRVTLPAVRTCFPQDAQVDSSQLEEKATAQTEKARDLILIVEDQEDIRNYLVEEMRKDFAILSARNGKEALAIAIERIPDIILADVMMPEMDGYQLAREVRSHADINHIPILLQSALPPEEGKVEGIDAGALDFISKPVSVPLLKGRIRNLLQLRQRFAEQLKKQLMLKTNEGHESPNPENEFIKKARQVMQEHAADSNFGAQEFASLLGMSRPTFYRKLKALVNLSPIDFIRTYRMELALSLLRNGVKTTEVAQLVGYSESSAFNRGFKRHHGCSPSEYIQKQRAAIGDK